MNISGRRLTGALVFMLCLMAQAAGAQAKMIKVTFPSLYPTGSTALQDGSRLSYVVSVPQVVYVPDTPYLDTTCSESDCVIYLNDGYFDENGKDVTSLVALDVHAFEWYGKTTVRATWREFIRELNRENYSPHERTLTMYNSKYQALFQKYKVKTMCLMYSYQSDSPTPPAGFPVLGHCVPARPVNTTCKMTPKAIKFSYGMLGRTTAAGTALSQNVNVSCTGQDVLFALRLSTGSNDIPLSNGMTAVLSADGNMLDQDHYQKLSQGTKNIKLTSTLSGTPEGTGPFSGSAALISEYF